MYQTDLIFVARPNDSVLLVTSNGKIHPSVTLANWPHQPEQSPSWSTHFHNSLAYAY